MPIIPTLKRLSQEDGNSQPVWELNGSETSLNYKDPASPQKRVRFV